MKEAFFVAKIYQLTTGMSEYFRFMLYAWLSYSTMWHGSDVLMNFFSPTWPLEDNYSRVVTGNASWMDLVKQWERKDDTALNLGPEQDT